MCSIRGIPENRMCGITVIHWITRWPLLPEHISVRLHFKVVAGMQIQYNYLFFHILPCSTPVRLIRCALEMAHCCSCREHQREELLLVLTYPMDILFHLLREDRA